MMMMMMMMMMVMMMMVMMMMMMMMMMMIIIIIMVYSQHFYRVALHPLSSAEAPSGRSKENENKSECTGDVVVLFPWPPSGT